MLYRIARITRLNGNPMMNPDTVKRIGREGHATQMAVGLPLLFSYAAPDVGTLRTTPVVKIRERPGRTIQVSTKHSVYYLQEVEARETDGAVIDRE